ncbi:hypothetical protein BO70DRAFT_362677 [Aspergillus heteromorphus CBS 117.55]|uniref:Lysine-specific metallo-endopeptidase domain-containing protein n=1 Tax=Aspergillus heteromorphus CBS 117.55 TaxID=1448321 RepID=A0A317W568_9EURO|nr:uncharacterized protein BO70DRAFT_362677 [Aspergillus heteromorphus CBS 117.55]PWY80721.1 hypothetical protein BO70DRAFT_362677 [Aspergillus heteromorphus CBS 117.55]
MEDIGEHQTDVKEDRKSKRRENPSDRRCWDWMIVSGACHYARDRISFTDYRPVERTIGDSKTYVAGVGSVELNVLPGPGLPPRTILLHEVLHIPAALSNGFNFGKYLKANGGETKFGPGVWTSTDGEGRPLWTSQPFAGLDKLLLAGNPQGESFLGDGPKMLSMYFSGEDLEGIMS